MSLCLLFSLISSFSSLISPSVSGVDTRINFSFLFTFHVFPLLCVLHNFFPTIEAPEQTFPPSPPPLFFFFTKSVPRVQSYTLPFVDQSFPRSIFQPFKRYPLLHSSYIAKVFPTPPFNLVRICLPTDLPPFFFNAGKPICQISRLFPFPFAVSARFPIRF